MKIHADLTRAAFVDTRSLEWQSSPAEGVWRKMLDRDGNEVARATSLVRYDPGRAFPTHSHGGGEEFFVLAGVFSDEHGDYPAGTYVRNPVGSAHAPASRPGCVLFVKLRQMAAGETRLVLATREGVWLRSWEPGVSTQVLFDNPSTGEHVQLERWTRSTELAERVYPKGVELLTLEGHWADAEVDCTTGSWLRLPARSRHTPHTDSGCLLWTKRGHLG